MLAVHQQMEWTGNCRAGNCKTHCTEQGVTSQIAAHRVPKAQSSLAVGIQTNRASSGSRKGREVPPVQGQRDPLAQWQWQTELGRAWRHSASAAHKTPNWPLNSKQDFAFFPLFPHKNIISGINAQPARCRMETGVSLWEWGQPISQQLICHCPLMFSPTTSAARTFRTHQKPLSSVSLISRTFSLTGLLRAFKRKLLWNASNTISSVKNSRFTWSGWNPPVALFIT